jgi:hypothetical protein
VKNPFWTYLTVALLSVLATNVPGFVSAQAQTPPVLIHDDKPACPPASPCEKRVVVELSQTSYTLNVWKQIRDHANAVEVTLPVSCQFYDQVNVGDDLLQKKFRWGSLATGGSFGNWNLKVVRKQ